MLFIMSNSCHAWEIIKVPGVGRDRKEWDPGCGGSITMRPDILSSTLVQSRKRVLLLWLAAAHPNTHFGEEKTC